MHRRRDNDGPDEVTGDEKFQAKKNRASHVLAVPNVIVAGALHAPKHEAPAGPGLFDSDMRRMNGMMPADPMGGMAMPGGWTLSMVWTPMPGETWAGGGARFVAMWVVMMVAMMLPPLLPMLARLRGNRLAALAGAGYFSVWALFGVAVYAVGSAIARAELAWPALARLACFHSVRCCPCCVCNRFIFRVRLRLRGAPFSLSSNAVTRFCRRLPRRFRKLRFMLERKDINSASG